jgi:sugar lactone lactonase YvrE
MKHTVLVVMLAFALLTVVATAGSAAPTGAPGEKAAASSPDAIVFNGQGNDLDVYASRPPFKTQKVYTTREKDPKGFDINAQICFFGPGNRSFIAGEDTGQPDPVQGWGIFRLRGNKVGSLKARQIGKLQPTYQGSADNAENYGCGVLSDGRIVTSDIGNQAEGDGDGQLIIWFPPFTKGFTTLATGTEGAVPYCKLDIGIATAGGIAVDDDDNIYVASARGATTGVNKYTGPFPTSAKPAGGCDGTDGTGAPKATTITRKQFIAPTNNLLTPNAIVPSPDGGWYVSSVFTGVINEYDHAGAFARTILQPPAGETLGAKPFSTGTPLGLGIGPDGTLYYADIGIVVSSKGIGPGSGTGNVRRITFEDGEPQAPETMASGLAFPDGIGVFVPKGR